MRKLHMIVLGGVCVSLLPLGEVWAELNCTATPDCASLGYTMSIDECTGLAMAVCPTDSGKVFCQKSLTASGSSTLKTINPVTCVVGTVLGGNGSCYEIETPAGVSPVAVVFDTNKRLAIALTDINADGTPGKEYMAWATVDDYDTDIANCDTSSSSTDSLETCAPDGRANTDIMLKTTGGGTHTAAQAVNKYEPEGCTVAFCKKTKWFIPSLYEWSLIRKQYFKVMSRLATVVLGDLEQTKLKENGLYHTSNEDTKGRVFHENADWYDFYTSSPKTKGAYLRPIVKY